MNQRNGAQQRQISRVVCSRAIGCIWSMVTKLNTLWRMIVLLVGCLVGVAAQAATPTEPVFGP